MKIAFATVVATSMLFAGAAFAQTTTAPNTTTPSTTRPSTATPSTTTPGAMSPGTGSVSGPGNPATKDPTPTTAAQPVEGANSFTEGQARSRIESQGFSNVTALTKGDDGVWRGKAAKAGTNMDVAVDFKGNVTSK